MALPVHRIYLLVISNLWSNTQLHFMDRVEIMNKQLRTKGITAQVFAKTLSSETHDLAKYIASESFHNWVFGKEDY